MNDEQLRAVAAAVKIDRVMGRIRELAAQAPSGQGGVTRLPFSPQEAKGMETVAGWMEEAGLTVAYDALGDMYGSTDGNRSGAPVLMAASHLDSVPNGGAYDGILGVVGAIEAMEAMRAAGAQPGVALEIAVWRAEEASVFSQGRLGSVYFTGQVRLETIRSWDRPGLGVAEDLERMAARPQRAPGRTVRGYLELHIEQGRRLEEAGIPIGVVTGIPGAIRWRIELKGRPDHSGATPMGSRRDALAAAAELILEMERAGLDEREYDTVATVAAVQVTPGAWNVVPGWAELRTDVRGTDVESVERVLERVRQKGAQMEAERGVAFSYEETTRGKPVKLDVATTDRIEATAELLGLRNRRMPSGAGHDAQTVAPYCPAGMVFIPSVGGVSHCPEEESRPEDIRAGIQLLAATWASLA